MADGKAQDLDPHSSGNPEVPELMDRDQDSQGEQKRERADRYVVKHTNIMKVIKAQANDEAIRSDAI